MKVSKRAQAVPPSATLAVTARAKELKAQGINVIGFGAGEPDFDTPEYIKDAAIAALKAGKTKYTPASGTIELKKAIAEKLKKDNGLDYAPEQIVVNIGAKHSVYGAMQAVLDPGDTVILPAPYWLTYPEAIKLAEARVKVVKTSRQNSYKMTPGQLKKAISPKTKMLVMNSPNNPGGFTYTPEELAALAKVLEGTDVVVMSDEIYERLIYGDTKFVSFASLSQDAYSRTLTINGFSKTYAMTGWRLGYTAGPVDVIKAMSRLQDHSTSNPVTFAQDAAIAALKDPNNEVEKMRIEFEKRAKFMAERLNGIKGIQCPQPTGAFYCFPDVSAHYGKTIGGLNITGSMDFTKGLLEQANVAVVPGLPFGCDKNIRLSFACSMQNIGEGLDRLQKWLGQ
jgi:aspartate aminotransferase